MEYTFATYNSPTPSNKEKLVVGIDIGTTKIACVVGKIDSLGKVTILGIGRSKSDGVKRGIVLNIDQTVASIKEAVNKAEIECGIKVHRVNVGIAGQHIKSIQQPGIYTRKDLETEISLADLQALKEDMFKIHVPAGESIIHVIPQEYTVDTEGGIKDPVGMAGVRLQANFHIITGSLPAIKNIYRCVKLSGLEVGELTLEPIASSAAVLSDEEKEAGVALVDIGGGTTDIAIFHDGLIRHTAVIPFGGNILTEDIKTGCSILSRHAEQLKVQYGSALAAETQNAKVVVPGLNGRTPKEITLGALSGIIEARMKEILELVHFEIMRSGYERKLIGGIVLTGGGAQLKHIKQLVEYITGLDCRIGKPIEHVINYSDESQLPPALSTGVGLVITGEENVGEDYFERELADPIVQQVETPEVEESPKFEETPIDAASAEDFMSFMTSIGVAGSDDDLHEEKSSFQNTIEEEEQTITDIVEEETVKPVTRSRKGRNPLESFLGRFKGFFENDEAVN
jgi:cell division protein FtsA